MIVPSTSLHSNPQHRDYVEITIPSSIVPQVVRRSHMSPISPQATAAVLNAHSENLKHHRRYQGDAAGSAFEGPVHGIAILDRNDVTDMERRYASTYFEAVDPEGHPWMEGLETPTLPPPPHRRHSGTFAASQGGKNSKDAAVSEANPLSRSMETEKERWPSYVSYGVSDAVSAKPPFSLAARISRKWGRHDSHCRAGSRVISLSRSSGSREAGMSSATTTPSPFSPVARPPPAPLQERCSSASSLSTGNVVLTDECVSDLPWSYVTAFAHAYRPVVSAMPSLTPKRKKRVSVPVAPLPLPPEDMVPALTQVSLHSGVIIQVDSAGEKVEACVAEAMTMRRPQFRRRSSFEVYGSHTYGAESLAS